MVRIHASLRGSNEKEISVILCKNGKAVTFALQRAKRHVSFIPLEVVCGTVQSKSYCTVLSAAATVAERRPLPTTPQAAVQEAARHPASTLHATSSTPLAAATRSRAECDTP